MNLPPSWNKMGWTAKAGYLVGAHLAKDYSAACAMLKELPSRKRKPAATYTPATRQIRLPYAD